jgi:hypothetical protein|tara:strand:- start:958 stop:1500 length:543 start_codon:yes stop_codon:yes gene_type:complete
MAKKLQNKWLTREQYKEIEEAIRSEGSGAGWSNNSKIKEMMVEKYSNLPTSTVKMLPSLISARRVYIKKTALFNKSKAEPTETSQWDLVEEETVSSVRPSMKREVFTPPNNMEATVSHQEYVNNNTTKSKSPISPVINDWTVKTVVITSNLGVINISLHHPSLNTREMSKILKSILPKQR